MARREGQVARIPGIGDLVLLGELSKSDVEYVCNQIGDDRRTGAALRKRILEARNLGDDRCDLVIELEALVADKEPPDPPEIEGWEKVLQIEIQDIPAALVAARIRDDRKLFPKPVRQWPPSAFGINFLSASIEDIGKHRGHWQDAVAKS